MTEESPNHPPGRMSAPSPHLARAYEGLLFWSAVVLVVVSLVIATGATEIHHNIYAAAFFVSGAIAGTGAVVIRALS